MYVTLMYVLCSVFRLFSFFQRYICFICNLLIINLCFLKDARRTTALVLSTLTCSSVFLDPKKTPATDIPDLLKYAGTLGVTKADLPAKLKTHVQAALDMAQPAKQDDKKDGKKDKKKQEKKGSKKEGVADGDEPKAKKAKKEKK
jgi:hypothetical protein